MTRSRSSFDHVTTAALSLKHACAEGSVTNLKMCYGESVDNFWLPLVQTLWFLDCMALGDGPICCPETSVTTYHPTPCNVREVGKPQTLFHLQDGGIGIVSFLTGAGTSGRIFTRQLHWSLPLLRSCAESCFITLRINVPLRNDLR